MDRELVKDNEIIKSLGLATIQVAKLNANGYLYTDELFNAKYADIAQIKGIGPKTAWLIFKEFHKNCELYQSKNIPISIRDQLMMIGVFNVKDAEALSFEEMLKMRVSKKSTIVSLYNYFHPQQGVPDYAVQKAYWNARENKARDDVLAMQTNTGRGYSIKSDEEFIQSIKPANKVKIDLLLRRAKGETLQTIANELGISRERARQLENKYANKLFYKRIKKMLVELNNTDGYIDGYSDLSKDNYILIWYFVNKKGEYCPDIRALKGEKKYYILNLELFNEIDSYVKDLKKRKRKVELTILKKKLIYSEMLLDYIRANGINIIGGKREGEMDISIDSSIASSFDDIDDYMDIDDIFDGMDFDLGEDNISTTDEISWNAIEEKDKSILIGVDRIIGNYYNNGSASEQAQVQKTTICIGIKDWINNGNEDVFLGSIKFKDYVKKFHIIDIVALESVASKGLYGTIDLQYKMENQLFIAEVIASSSIDKERVSLELSLLNYMNPNKADRAMCFWFDSLGRSLDVIDIKLLEDNKVCEIINNNSGKI